MKKLNGNGKSKKLGILIATLLLPALAWCQATSSLVIPLTNQSIQKTDSSNSKIDLLKEARLLKPALNSVSNIEIQMVEVEAKSYLGGAEIFLEINNSLSGAVAIETNPDEFLSKDPRSFRKFELKNIDRVRVTSAKLVLKNVSMLKINSVHIFFGSADEVRVVGDLLNKQAREIGGISDNRDTTPTSQTVAKAESELYGKINMQPQPVVMKKPTVNSVVVSKPVTVSKPVVKRPIVAKPKENFKNCLSYRNRNFCVGDIVLSFHQFPQKILAVNKYSGEVLVSCPDLADEPYLRHVTLLQR